MKSLLKALAHFKPFGARSIVHRYAPPVAFLVAPDVCRTAIVDIVVFFSCFDVLHPSFCFRFKLRPTSVMVTHSPHRLSTPTTVAWDEQYLNLDGSDADSLVLASQPMNVNAPGRFVEFKVRGHGVHNYLVS